MKKYIFMAAALMMMGMGMSSCSNEDVINEVEQAPKKVQLTFIATFDMGGETRAAWKADGITPEFSTGDKVGVYSDANPDVVALDVTVDGAGNATISGLVEPATEYHLVFPYRAGSTYNSGTKTISGFAMFDSMNWGNYPPTALHYAMASSSDASVSFMPLCAILKGEQVSDFSKRTYVSSAKLSAPVITVDGTGGATVDATVYPVAPGNTSYLINNIVGGTRYIPVAAGSVTLTNFEDNTKTKTASVVAGKIYTVTP